MFGMTSDDDRTLILRAMVIPSVFYKYLIYLILRLYDILEN